MIKRVKVTVNETESVYRSGTFEVDYDDDLISVSEIVDSYRCEGGGRRGLTGLDGVLTIHDYSEIETCDSEVVNSDYNIDEEVEVEINESDERDEEKESPKLKLKKAW